MGDTRVGSEREPRVEIRRPGFTRREVVRGGAAAGLAIAVGGLAPRGTRGQDASPAASPDGPPIKVAFVYVGPIGDLGWTWAHDQGRLALEQNLPNVETVYQESVPETAADAERVIRGFAQDGAKVIFTTSFGYMQPTINVAKDFPDTIFVHISGYMTAENVGTGFGRIEEPRYVAGLIAGKMTKTNKLGYVAAFPIPEVIRGINAFSLGVRAANPNATVNVVWTATWFDPLKERQAGEALLDGGADVIAQHQDTAGPQQAAEERGVYGVGYNADMSKMAPKAVLTSAIWHWDVFYIQTVQQVQAGIWESGQYWGGWKDGIVDLAPIGPMVPDDVRQMAEAEIVKFKSGEKDIFTIFTGPINDQSGKEKVPAGQALTAEQLLGTEMNWFVEGVEGDPTP